MTPPRLLRPLVASGEGCGGRSAGSEEGGRAARAGQDGDRAARREVAGPAQVAGLAPGLATRLHRNGLTTRGQVATWYGAARSDRPLYRIGPKALAAIAAWLGVAEEETPG